ncbi:MAG: YncE family protein [Alkalispirochaeta sp.]
MKGTITLLILCFLWVIPSVPASSPGVIRLELTVFPPEAEVTVIPPESYRGGPVVSSPIRSTSGIGTLRRVYPALPPATRLRITAPGYEEAMVHLPGGAGDSGVISIEERLFPAGGPLRLSAELPTGDGPKSVAFVPGGRIVVPLLWDTGADTFQLTVDRLEQVSVEPIGRIQPPPEIAGEEGFVEPLCIAAHGELWISQMNGDRLHRFDLVDMNYRESISAAGQWPKVMAVVPPTAFRPTGPVVESAWNPNRQPSARGTGGKDRALLVTSNWLSETVVFHDRATGELVHDVHLEGQPRGIAVFDDPREVWVTEFSTGDIVVIEPYSGAIVDRLPLGPGAARHIVAHPRDRRVYYSDMYHGTVSVIDGDTREVRLTRRFGSNINTIAVDPRGRYLYISERGRNNPESYHLPGPAFGRIFVVDADTLEPVQTVWGRHQPTGLAVSPDGTLLAATDFLDDNMSIYTVAE